ncbi:MAG: hypothetical protein HYY49_08065 [Ignavibacteriales bacterium]|nr:hypothetical protein [Ignavibacteriales bacterium]
MLKEQKTVWSVYNGWRAAGKPVFKAVSSRSSGFQGRVIEEQWMKPLGQMMVGTGRTTSKGKSVFFEFLQIVHADSGIFYIARPKGNPPTPFKLIKAANNEIVFENLSHDFPQRVMYTAGVDELFARVEGMVKGELRFEEFRYRRIKCE